MEDTKVQAKYEAGMNIILIGFKRCGKTLIGKILADRLKKEFYDTDSIIESIYRKNTKGYLSFRDIYKKHGGEYFRNLEKKALERIGGLEDSVISLGGGTIFSDFGFRISDFGFVVYLHVEPDILYERIIKNGIPAFFDSSNPKKSFDTLYAERLPMYKKLANIVINNSGDAEETISGILQELKNKPLTLPSPLRGED